MSFVVWLLISRLVIHPPFNDIVPFSPTYHFTKGSITPELKKKKTCVPIFFVSSLSGKFCNQSKCWTDWAQSASWTSTWQKPKNNKTKQQWIPTLSVLFEFGVFDSWCLPLYGTLGWSWRPYSWVQLWGSKHCAWSLRNSWPLSFGHCQPSGQECTWPTSWSFGRNTWYSWSSILRLATLLLLWTKVARPGKSLMVPRPILVLKRWYAGRTTVQLKHLHFRLVLF